MESSLYLIALYMAKTSGGVESMEVMNVGSRQSCNEMASLVHMLTPEVPPGYEMKLYCDSKVAVEQVIENYDCRLQGQSDTKGLVSSTYACVPNQGYVAKISRWLDSLFKSAK